VDNGVLPSERIKQEVQWVLRGQEAAGHPLDRLVHLGEGAGRGDAGVPGPGLLPPWIDEPWLAQWV